jgi:hypothetical protein
MRHPEEYPLIGIYHILGTGYADLLAHKLDKLIVWAKVRLLKGAFVPPQIFR